MARLLLAGATLNVWVLLAILAAAFGAQLIAGEPPCPLCVAQRIALMLCALGPLHMLRRARDGALAARDVAVGGGIAILAALIGAATSTRQVLLHILPSDAGFGSPVLGLHLYTWCLIAFACQIAASDVMLIGAAWLQEERIRCHRRRLRAHGGGQPRLGDRRGRLPLGSAAGAGRLSAVQIGAVP